MLATAKRGSDKGDEQWVDGVHAERGGHCRYTVGCVEDVAKAGTRHRLHRRGTDEASDCAELRCWAVCVTMKLQSSRRCARKGSVWSRIPQLERPCTYSTKSIHSMHSSLARFLDVLADDTPHAAAGGTWTCIDLWVSLRARASCLFGWDDWAWRPPPAEHVRTQEEDCVGDGADHAEGKRTTECDELQSSC